MSWECRLPLGGQDGKSRAEMVHARVEPALTTIHDPASDDVLHASLRRPAKISDIFDITGPY